MIRHTHRSFVASALAAALLAGLIDVRQAEILVTTAAQTIPDFERRIEQTENVISIFDAELGPVRNQRDELLAIVRLYKALGAGWQP